MPFLDTEGRGGGLSFPFFPSPQLTNIEVLPRELVVEARAYARLADLAPLVVVACVVLIGGGGGGGGGGGV